MKNEFWKKVLRILKSDHFLAFSSFAFVFFLYLRTLAPSLLSADAAEFQTLAYTMGMTHPSGYSTYIFLGKLFTLLPVSNIAYRVNLMSGFFGAFAAGQVYYIIRLLGMRKIAGLIGAIGLGLHPLFWQRTIFAETYAPAASMISSIWLLMLLWRDHKNARYLFVAGVLGGVSVGIHSTVIMTAVSVLIYMLFKARQRKDWLYAGLGAFLGVLLAFVAFLYLDYHNPPSSIYHTVYSTNLTHYGLTPDQFDTPVERLLGVFPAQSFWTYYFSASFDVIRLRLTEYFSFYPLWESLLILLGAFSLFFLRKEKESLLSDALYALVGFIIVWGFAVTVEFSVYKEFYVPVAIFVHVWLGIGVSVVLQNFEQFIERVERLRIIPAQIAGSLLGVVLIAALLIHSRTDIRLAVSEGYTTFIRDEHMYPYFNPDRYTRLAKKVLNKVEDDAIIFAIWDRLYSYVYTAHILEGRSTIEFHEIWPNVDDDTLNYIEAQIDHRPIYLTTEHSGVAQYYDLEQVGDELYRLRRKK